MRTLGGCRKDTLDKPKSFLFRYVPSHDGARREYEDISISYYFPILM